MSARRPPSERGSALILVLFVFVVCEVAILVAALEVQRVSAQYGLEKQRLAADLLAESGIAHAFARLDQEPAWRGSAGLTLATGSYTAAVADRGPGALRVTSVGVAAAGRSVELVVDARVVQGRWRAVARSHRHFVASRAPAPTPPR